MVSALCISKSVQSHLWVNKNRLKFKEQTSWLSAIKSSDFTKCSLPYSSAVPLMVCSLCIKLQVRHYTTQWHSKLHLDRSGVNLPQFENETVVSDRNSPENGLWDLFCAAYSLFWSFHLSICYLKAMSLEMQWCIQNKLNDKAANTATI